MFNIPQTVVTLYRDAIVVWILDDATSVDSVSRLVGTDVVENVFRRSDVSDACFGVVLARIRMGWKSSTAPMCLRLKVRQLIFR